MPPPSSQRKIIHIDMDCFYAAVEVRDNPSLRGKPVAVGGSADRRGVLCTANYEARKFGVRSAMPTATAIRRCPDLELLPINMAKYREVSKHVQSIFREYTDLVEPLSLDEAYLDVSDCDQQQGSAVRIAAAIRARIEAEQQLTASAGISVNKFIAKIASDWNKPNGQFAVPPDAVDGFVEQLPVTKLFGVGKVTAAKFHKLEVQTCGDLQSWSLPELQQHFGSFGERLHGLCRGIDNRRVSPNRVRKSVSVERTFSTDQSTLQQLQEQLPNLLEQLKNRYQPSADRYGISGIYLKLKFNDFQQTTVGHSGNYFWDEDLLAREFHQLLETGWQRRQGRAVRLLGFGLTVFPTATETSQLSLL